VLACGSPPGTFTHPASSFSLCSCALPAKMSALNNHMRQNVAHLFSPKKIKTLSHKKPDNSSKTYTHKKCITKHKTDIKTRQKHRKIQFQSLEASYFSVITVVRLLLIKYIDHFLGNSKILETFCASCMVIDSRHKRFVINMQPRQCFARTKLCDCKKARFCLDFFMSKKCQVR